MHEPTRPPVAVDLVRAVAEVDFNRDCHNMRVAALQELAAWRQTLNAVDGEEVRASYDSLPDHFGRTRSIDVNSTGLGAFHVITSDYGEKPRFTDYVLEPDSKGLVVTRRSSNGEAAGESVVAGNDSDGLAWWADVKNIFFDCEKRQSRA